MKFVVVIGHDVKNNYKSMYYILFYFDLKYCGWGGEAGGKNILRKTATIN